MSIITEKNLKKSNQDLYDSIIEYNKTFGGIKWVQKLYNYNNHITELPKCENCGGDVKFHRYTKGYQRCCSNFCHITSKRTDLIRNETKKERYGNIYYNNREKAKETNLNKFGETSPMKNKDILEKRNKTNIERYGHASPLLNDDVLKKSSDKKFQIYGDINYNNRDAAKQTCLERYGVDSPIKNPESLKRMIETNQKKFGVDNVFQNEEMIQRLKLINETTFKEKWCKILNINFDDVLLNGEIVTISNHCKKHKNFSTTKNSLYDRNNEKQNFCTECFGKNKNESIGEKEIRYYIEEDLKQETKKIRIKNKEIDIFIPSHKFGIEYNGLYWHSEIYKENDYHIKKLMLCHDNNINLIQIFEDEWFNKKEIVKSLIATHLNQSINTIDANICDIINLTNSQSGEFLHENDINDIIESDLNLGLYYENELVSVATFKNDDGNYKICNYSNRVFTNVHDSLKVLFTHLIKENNVKSINISVDKRFGFDVNEIIKLGFRFVDTLKPKYLYCKNNVKNRFKPEIVELNLSNNSEKFYKVFDCGCDNYLLKK